MNYLSMGQKWAEKKIRREATINRALRSTAGNTYIEIGVQKGNCFRQIIASFKVAVDPVKQPELRIKADEHYYEKDSNTFFLEHAKEVFEGRQIDVAFVDGMHEFTQALQDVVNLIPYMASNGVILIHDCNPTTREHVGNSVTMRNGWTGDVWKVGYFLNSSCEQYNYFTLRSDWGIGVLTGFDNDKELTMPNSEVLQQYKKLDFDYLETNRKIVLNLKPGWYSMPYFFLKRK